MAIKFNGNDLPSFVKINNVALSIMPTIERTTIKVSGRDGSYDFGNTFDDREIGIEFTIVAESEADLKDKAREFGNWLYTDEYAPLVILDEPDKYYMAKITGGTELNETLKIGQGSLTFVAEPFSYGDEITYNFNPTEENSVLLMNNGGDVETHPKIHLEFTQPTTSFALATDEEIMVFGTPSEDEEPIKDTNPLIFHDDMTSLNGWTTATTIENGTVYGSFEIDTAMNHAFVQSQVQDDEGNWYRDYGTGIEKWHGASAIKALPKTAKDFRLEARIGIKSEDRKQLGRVLIGLLDKNGKRIGRIQMYDKTTYNMHNKAFAQIGDVNHKSHTFVQTHGQYAGYWDDFSYGQMVLERIGNKWRAYFSQVESKSGRPTDVHYNTWETHYVDTKNIALEEVAQIQIHIGAYRHWTPAPHMKIYDLKVFSYDEATNDEIPVVFRAGDILDIDTETGEILKNGEPFYEYFDPSSQFIKFNKGINGLTVAPTITTNGTVKFRERWR